MTQTPFSSCRRGQQGLPGTGLPPTWKQSWPPPPPPPPPPALTHRFVPPFGLQVKSGLQHSARLHSPPFDVHCRQMAPAPQTSGAQQLAAEQSPPSATQVLPHWPF